MTAQASEALRRAALVRARSLNLAVARRSPAMFVRMVLRDEETGGPIEQADYHDQWQHFLSDSDRAVVWSHIEAGKTSQVSIGRALWELGRDPNLRIVIVSKTNENAKKIVRSQAQYIQRSPTLRSIFPDLVPSRDKSQPWNATMLTVQRDTYSKDPSVQCFGLGGSPVGSRIDLLIADDILDVQNTSTVAACRETLAWWKANFGGRLTNESRVWLVGNAWSYDDVLHVLSREPRYKSLRFPVVDANGEPVWPQRWPLARIDKAREDLGPIEALRQLMCVAPDATSARFKREWIEACMARGEDWSLVESVDDEDLVGGYHVVHGVDLAVQRHTAADLTVFFTVLLHPNGDRQVLNIDAGRWSADDILRRFAALNDRYGGLFIVENNAAQDYMRQLAASGTRANVRPFTTGRNKADPSTGVASLGAEMAASKWIIPNMRGRLGREVSEWISEMYAFDPRAHTGDRLMASWFAREGCRVLQPRNQDGARRGGSAGVRLI